MAAASSSGIARTNPLIRLEPATFVALRPWGKYGKFTFFTVITKSNQDSASQVSYNLRVDEVQQEATLVHEDTTELLKSEGGLHSMNEPMRIFEKHESKRSAYIDRQNLWDFTETRDQEQFVWHFPTVPFSLQPKKEEPLAVSRRKYVREDNWLAFILPCVKSTSTSFMFRDKCLTAWQRAILLMGMLKMFYCHYKMHALPMPNGVLHLMPPGAPGSKSIEFLQRITDVIFRVACRDKNKNQIMEILDSSTKEIVLVLFYQEHKARVNNRLYFINQFGQTIFYSTGRRNLDVYDCNDRRIGDVEETQINHESSNYHGTYKIGIGERLPVSISATSCKAFVYRDNHRRFAVYFRPGEHNLYYCDGFGFLPNELKALSLCYGMTQAIFFHKVWKDGIFPEITEYQFRRKEVCPLP